MGLTITGQAKLIVKVKEKHDGGTWKKCSLMISNKDADGNWSNNFLDCAFKKGTEIPGNKSKIEIKNSFLTFDSYNGNTTPKVFITDFAVLEQGEATGTAAINAPIEVVDGFMNVPDDGLEMLPFGNI